MTYEAESPQGGFVADWNATELRALEADAAANPQLWISRDDAQAGQLLGPQQVEVRGRHYAKLAGAPTVTVDVVAPMQVSEDGTEIMGVFRSAHPEEVVGKKLRVLLVGMVSHGWLVNPPEPLPAGERIGAGRPGAHVFRPIEQPFDLDGVARVKIPISYFDRQEPLQMRECLWPEQQVQLLLVPATH